MSMSPKYRHNCASCQFLGSNGGYDLYFCDQTKEGGKLTVIARYGDNLEDLASGYPLGLKYFFTPEDEKVATADEAVGWALRRAVNKGLLSPAHMQKFYDDCRDWHERQVIIATRGRLKRPCPLHSTCSGKLRITFDLNYEGVPEAYKVDCADCGYTVGYYDDIQSAVTAATSARWVEEIGKDSLIHRQMQVALARTITAYEELIANPEENLPKWKNFGEFHACNFCRVADSVRKDGEVRPCAGVLCPLLEAGDGVYASPCWGNTAGNLKRAIKGCDFDLVDYFAKDRLETIKESARKMGYTIN